MVQEIDFFKGGQRGRGRRDAIDTFGMHFSQAGLPIEDALGWQRITNDRLFRGGWPIITDLTPLASPVAVARINANGWTARCPYECGGSEYVDVRFPLFYCHSCRNQEQRRPLKVQFPNKGQMTAIETLLLKRPLAASRNWTQGITPAQLQLDNERHGDV